MLDQFDKRKSDVLDKDDKSFIGEWDDKIKDLCGAINLKEDYYTTSSCSGRILIMKDQEKKGPGVFLWVSHDVINFRILKNVLRKIKHNGFVKFKQEPCIMHVACRTLEKAQELVDKAREVGWKRSGIITTSKRFIVELMSTEKLEFLIMDSGHLLVAEEYLKIVVKKSNENLKRTWEKIEKLEKLI